MTEREQKVLRLRFGLDDGRARTLENEKKNSMSQRERIRQIEAKALRKLRHPSRSRKLKDYGLMELSRRLRMNASFVTQGNRLADVGTDHGYIPIALRLERVIPSALAMNINPGPLRRAKEHIRQLITDRYTYPPLPMVYRLSPLRRDSI